MNNEFKEGETVDQFDLAVKRVQSLIASHAGKLSEMTPADNGIKRLDIATRLGKVIDSSLTIDGISLEEHRRRRSFRFPGLPKGRISPDIDLVFIGDEQKYEQAAPWSYERVKGRLVPVRYRFSFQTDPNGAPTSLKGMRYEYEEYDSLFGHRWDGFGISKKDYCRLCLELLEVIPQNTQSKANE